ncbi:hypothetical protein A2841_01015 [Candidatus Kaiserbacteria bacterium RIFCSPHIGHO2_01_FULL_48_10]|uniref:SHS2 domain-containing protein n=1 Tax=Candidatus Kaiserbacteria bacterium RIFCSPHIGHO2_01_FULL_48_10 TaxID=1798476 RepID=A0A1F6C5B5_9BACT|nr:MAG: hypothetical protein A2841_01015 [Candidatus Kaiserbacteria bacterium RIFCSPHIGHO2_01_FULL_48_10]
MGMQNALLSVFPPPAYVATPSAGVDISGGSIKWAIFSGYGSHTKLGTYGEMPLPQGVVTSGDIEQEDTVVEIIRTLRMKHRIRHVNACLPEKKAYLYRVLVPTGTTNLRAGVEFDFETHVPLPPAETIFDFEPIQRTDAGTVVAVTAYAKRIVNTYNAVFERAGVMLHSLEVESQALARTALGPTDRDKVVMMIDFGKHTTRIAVAEYGVVAFTATLDVGGDALTAAVMKHFNVSEPEAEQIKNEKGFLMGAENKSLVEALVITVSVVKDEIVKHFSFWNNPTADELPRKPIEKIVVCGGNANLKAFPEYLEGALGVPVAVADVWVNAFSLDEYIPSMQFSDSLEYATAIGLALKGRTKSIW